ncbi:tRNA pseudouridine(38-40) synthase TruA [Portibacter marinus]|uniref:tRNA pseudouridine(38-40) synthase TruA n=1 Tax=Portibacter marinus TaxID=2898660 RepID=UPI001F3B6795|nr:tRNA pseudouridine(38-40) synthase TruA [Portibacter marinus]
MSDRYFFEIAFDGTAYSGWQRQKSVPTVQQTIEEAFERLLNRQVKIHGCSRTDAGVHARQYFFHMDLEAGEVDFVPMLNMGLPNDISVLHYQKVNQLANAQRHTIHKTYQYQFTNQRSPFTTSPYTYVYEVLDYSKMQECVQKLIGKHEFRNFCKRPDLVDNTMCHITNAQLTRQKKQKTYVLEITSNRFLHHMMRLIAGNIIKVGKGRLPISKFVDYLDLRDDPKYFEIAPAQGLILSNVIYDLNKINA